MKLQDTVNLICLKQELIEKLKKEINELCNLTHKDFDEAKHKIGDIVCPKDILASCYSFKDKDMRVDFIKISTGYGVMFNQKARVVYVCTVLKKDGSDSLNTTEFWYQ